MTSRFSACVLALLLFCYFSDSYGESTLPDPRDPTFIRDCVETHNTLRGRVDPAASNMRYMGNFFFAGGNCPPRYIKIKTEFRAFPYFGKVVFKRKCRVETPLITWDPDLAKTAKAWAKKCIFKHNIHLKEKGKVHPRFDFAGENIWTGSVSVFTVKTALSSWFNEVEFYDYDTNKCDKVCGHYTQVVWATSYKVGCAVHFCPKMALISIRNAAHFVCNYGPPGNYPVRPYKTGAPCSECGGEQCVDQLCRNPDRDKVIENPRWRPDWDRPACDEFCISIAILRLLLLILTFVATWLLPKYSSLVPASG